MIISIPNQIVDLQQNSYLTQNKLFLISKRIANVYVAQTYQSSNLILFFKNLKFLSIIMKTRKSFLFSKARITNFLKLNKHTFSANTLA